MPRLREGLGWAGSAALHGAMALLLLATARPAPPGPEAPAVVVELPEPALADPLPAEVASEDMPREPAAEVLPEPPAAPPQQVTEHLPDPPQQVTEHLPDPPQQVTERSPDSWQRTGAPPAPVTQVPDPAADPSPQATTDALGLPPPPPSMPPPPRPRPVPGPLRQTSQSAAASMAASAPVSTPATAAAPAAAAPSPTYISRLLAALERQKRYPEDARGRQAQGVALLRFRLQRDGRVVAARIERSAGDAALDAAVLAMVQRASPLPAPPADLPGETLDLTVPIRFALR